MSLARFVKAREFDRRGTEAKKRAPRKRQTRATSPSIVPRNDLQIVFTNEDATPELPKKVTRWNKVNEADKKLPELLTDVDEPKTSFAIVAGAAPIFNDVVYEVLVSIKFVEIQLEFATARPNPDARTRLCAARPRAVVNELSLVVSPVLRTSGVGEHALATSTIAELLQELDKLMVHQSGGKFEVRKGYLLPRNFAIPEKAPVDGAAGAVSQVIKEIALPEVSIGVTGQELLSLLTRAQRRGRIAKERRDCFRAL
jgi:hypothetical protein